MAPAEGHIWKRASPWNGVSAFANCGRAVRFMPILGVIELRARSALGLHLKLQPTRSDLVGLRPMARQAAARGRLRAGAAGRVGCGLPLTSRPGRPAHVARRSRSAGQLPRWRPGNRNRRLGKRRRVMPQRSTRSRAKQQIICVALHGLRTVEGEQRPGRQHHRPLPDPQKRSSATLLNSPCRSVVRQAVLAAATH
jgi:hypothetical protein